MSSIYGKKIQQRENLVLYSPEGTSIILWSLFVCILCLRGEKHIHRIRRIRCVKAISTDESSHSARKPQKMHRLCGTRKRKEFSAVGWFGSINYLTKSPPVHRSPSLPPVCPPPSTSRCSAGILAPKHRPLVPSMFPSRAQSPFPPPHSLSLSVFSLLRVDTLVDPNRPRSEISS